MHTQITNAPQGLLDTTATPVFYLGMAQEVEVGRLPDGTRFRMACGPFDDTLSPPRVRVTHHLYGTKLYTVGESRCRVVWQGQPALARFRQADGTQHEFETQRREEANLPVMVMVEPIADTNEGSTRGGQPAPMKARSHVDEAQVRALQGRYDFQRKSLERAIESGDAAKIEMAEARIAKIVGEAAEANVALTEPTETSAGEESVIDGIVASASPTPKPAKAGKVVAGKKTKDQQASADEMAQTQENQVATATKAVQAKTSLKEQNAVRLAALKAKKLTEVDGKAPGKAKKATAAKPKAEKKLASTHDCICGCGEETGGKFRPGHDARVKGMLYKVERGETEFESLPKTLIPYVKFAGSRATAGKDTSNYRVVKSPVKFPGRDDIEIVDLIEG